MTCFEQAFHNLVIEPGQMSCTLFGCGDFYDHDRESVGSL